MYAQEIPMPLILKYDTFISWKMYATLTWWVWCEIPYVNWELTHIWIYRRELQKCYGTLLVRDDFKVNWTHWLLWGYLHFTLTWVAHTWFCASTNAWGSLEMWWLSCSLCTTLLGDSTLYQCLILAYSPLFIRHFLTTQRLNVNAPVVGSLVGKKSVALKPLLETCPVDGQTHTLWNITVMLSSFSIFLLNSSKFKEKL